MLKENWRSIRAIEGSQQNGFEELCVQLARSEVPSNAKFYRKGRFDAGVECYCVFPDGREWGWQAKYFSSLGKNQWPQIDKSVRKALARHPRLTRYYICVPMDREEPRTKGRKHAMERWKYYTQKWEKLTKGRKVKFEWWGSSELIERLSRPEHIGRNLYWFNEQYFDDIWFKTHLGIAIRSAGPRYIRELHDELHIELPIAQKLEGFGRTGTFIDYVKAQAKEIRKNNKYAYNDKLLQENSDYGSLANSLQSSIDIILKNLAELKPEPIHEIPFSQISELVLQAREIANNILEFLYQQESKSDTQHMPEEHSRSVFPRFSFNDAMYLYQLRNALGDANEILEHANEICNNNLLIIKGDAGTGKTHLLCDIAKKRLYEGRPTILLMGQRFTSQEEPWRQALAHLDWGSNFAGQFVGALEAAAQAAGYRALLIIDAINEGEGLNIWPPHMSAFLSSLQNSSWIGTVLSIRSNYEDRLIPKEVQKQAITVTHDGFQNHEYDAMQTFFSYYGLDIPSTPVLHSEFQNPLFLRITCEGLQSQEKKILPRGFRGISATFDLYLQSVDDRLAPKLDYAPRSQIPRKALERLARLFVKTNQRWTTRTRAMQAVDNLIPNTGYENSVYHQLVIEGILIENIMPGHKDDQGEIVTIAYDRFTDHIISDILLQTHLDEEELEKAFAEGGGLHFILDEENSFLSFGLIEALWIQVPERTSRELSNIAPKLAKRWDFNAVFLQSIIWRKLDAFSEETDEILKGFIDTEHYPEDVMETILTVATLAKHPYNAKFLDDRLRQYSMSERDARWSTYLHRAWNPRIKNVIDRLLDWAFNVSPEDEIDEEVVELCAITLAWMFTTSNRPLRDRATKALVSLLTERWKPTLRLLKRFSDVNDLYVFERIYAAVYGITMRSHDAEQVGMIADYVYKQIFSKGTPPPHILLRDYARGIIERALYLKSKINIDVKHIRPPYNSEWPEIPTEEMIKPYMVISKDEEKELLSYHVISSVTELGDFARYVIGTNSRIGNWLSLRLGQPIWRSSEVMMKELLPTLEKHSQNIWRKYIEEEKSYNEAERRYSSLIGYRPPFDEDASDTDQSDAIIRERDIHLAMMEKALETTKEEFLDSLTAGQRIEIEPTLRQRNFGRREEPSYFDLSWIQRYIIKRVYDLGWRHEKFGDFDKSIRYPGRMGKKPERIGKKYQWIAYHSILAHISDHYQYIEGMAISNKGHAYDGPWQGGLYLRDIDPSITLSKPGDIYDNGHISSWWAKDYTTWVDKDAIDDWFDNEKDIPKIKDLIWSCNPSQTENRWLNLHSVLNWEQPRPVDVESSNTPTQNIWIKFLGYFVRKNDVDRFIKWTNEYSTMHFRLEPIPMEYHSVFLGEYGWSRAFEDFYNSYSNDDSDPFHGASFQCSCKPNDFDCSVEGNLDFQLPCFDLIEKLGLKWTGQGADFMDSESKLAAFDPTAHENGPTALLVREDMIRRYLDENDLTLYWIISGDKRLLPPRHLHGFLGYPQPLNFSGVFSLDDEEPNNCLKFSRGDG